MPSHALGIFLFQRDFAAFFSEILRRHTRHFLEKSREIVNTLEIKLLGNLCKRVLGVQNLVFSYLKFLGVNEFYQSFSGTALEISAKSRSVSLKYKRKLVYRYPLEVVIGNIGDYLIYKKRCFRSLLGIDIKVVFPYKTYEKIFKQNFKHLLGGEELVALLLHIVYRYVVGGHKYVSSLFNYLGKLFYV